MVKIGSQTIDTNIFLAPLAGCSDLAFRLISREHGARFCFYEMLDANSLIRQKTGNRDILQTHEKDTPIAAQILASEAPMALDAAQKLLTLVDPSFLDLNCACPAKKAIKKKAGAYLLTDIQTLSGILKTLSSRLRIPVTVKLRTGLDRCDYKKLSEIAVACETSGAAAIFIHGRTRVQGYAGEVDYAAIKTVKDSVSIPVFGSGNIFSPETAKKMFDETACDGILAARGALGNPWIFRDIERYIADGYLHPARDIECRKVALKRHLEYVNTFKKIRLPTRVGFMRKVAIWYMKNFSAASGIRRQISLIKSYEDMIELIDSLNAKNTRRPDRACL